MVRFGNRQAVPYLQSDFRCIRLKSFRLGLVLKAVTNADCVNKRRISGHFYEKREPEICAEKLGMPEEPGRLAQRYTEDTDLKKVGRDSAAKLGSRAAWNNLYWGFFNYSIGAGLTGDRGKKIDAESRPTFLKICEIGVICG